MKFSLAAVPLALLAISGYLANERGPFRLSQNFDPAYGYLLSSLSILDLHIPKFTDNPGITVEEIGSAVSLGRWIALGVTGDDGSISHSILTHPEAYLNAVRFTLSLLVAGSVFWAGWTMFQLTGSLLASLVLQSSVFLFRETIITLANVSPEPLLLAATFAMSAVLLPVFLRSTSEHTVEPRSSDGESPVKTRSALWSGACWGFGIATKFSFVPMGAIALVFHTSKLRLRFLIGGVAAALLFMLPIWPILYRPAYFLYLVFTHRGDYGQGARGLPSLGQLLSNLGALARMEPGFFALLVLYAAILLLLHLQTSGDRRASSVERLLWAGFVCIALQLAVALKQYRAHYMIPAFGLMAFINGCVVVLLLSREWKMRFRPVFAAAGALVFAAGIAQSGTNAYQWGQLGASENRDAAELTKITSSMPDCVVIGFYRSSVPGFGVGWGSEYAEGANARAVNESFPNTINYNRFVGKFLSPAPEPRLSEVQQMLSAGRCVLMQGTPITTDPLILPAGFSVAPIAELKNEGLYRLAWNPAVQ